MIDVLWGIGGLAPERRPEIAALGLGAVLAAALADLLIAGVLLD